MQIARAGVGLVTRVRRIVRFANALQGAGINQLLEGFSFISAGTKVSRSDNPDVVHTNHIEC